MLIKNCALILFMPLCIDLAIFGYDAATENRLAKCKNISEAVEASPKLLKIVEPIAQACGIKEKIIFLESKKQISSVYYASSESPYHIIVIQTHDPLSNNAERSEHALAFDAHHEIGHIANGDPESWVDKLTWLQVQNLSSFWIGFGAYLALSKLDPSPSILSKMGVALAASLASYKSWRLTSNYLASKKEDAADRFAFQKLLSQGKLGPVIVDVHTNLLKHDLWLRNLGYEYPQRLTDRYPSDLTRARAGLHEMKKYGYSLTSNTEIIIGDQPFRSRLFPLIDRYCPEYLEKKSDDEIREIYLI